MPEFSWVALQSANCVVGHLATAMVPVAATQPVPTCGGADAPVWLPLAATVAQHTAKEPVKQLKLPLGRPAMAEPAGGGGSTLLLGWTHCWAPATEACAERRCQWGCDGELWLVRRVDR